jgi:hypothetical protein
VGLNPLNRVTLDVKNWTCHGKNYEIHIIVIIINIIIIIIIIWGSWLRHCATSWKVAGSIPDGVIQIFHRLTSNPSGRTMNLGSTQHLTEMSTKNIFLFKYLTASNNYSEV